MNNKIAEKHLGISVLSSGFRLTEGLNLSDETEETITAVAALKRGRNKKKKKKKVTGSTTADLKMGLKQSLHYVKRKLVRKEESIVGFCPRSIRKENIKKQDSHSRILNF